MEWIKHIPLGEGRGKRWSLCSQKCFESEMLEPSLERATQTCLNAPDACLGCQYPVTGHSLWRAVDRLQISISTSVHLIVLTNSIMERKEYRIIEGKGTYFALSRQVTHLQLCTYIWSWCGTGTDLDPRDTTVDNTQSLTSQRGHVNEE